MRSDYNIVSPAERLANGVVQSVNVVLAVTGCVALGVLVGTQADPMQLAALAVYGTGLLAMVGASALYAWGRAGRRHTLYRHLDHAAILVMIAGTYTPFIVISFGGMQGRRLLALVWAVALVGIVGVDEEYRADTPWLRRQRVERLHFTGIARNQHDCLPREAFPPCRNSGRAADRSQLGKAEKARGKGPLLGNAGATRPERPRRLDWTIEGRNNDSYHSSECWAPHRGAFYELGMLLVEFSVLEIPHDVP